jgi:hypothetical protein
MFGLLQEIDDDWGILFLLGDSEVLTTESLWFASTSSP